MQKPQAIRPFIYSCIASTTLLCAAPVFASTAASQYFESEDIFALEYANDPQVSPDGKQIVYVRNSNDIMTDGTHSSLWLLDVKTGQQSPLFVDQFNYGSPRWSEDGNRIAFISDRSGSRQIHVHYVKENKTALVSQLTKSPGNLTWSPDGEQLAFTMNVPAQATPLAKAIKMPKKPEAAKWSEPAILIERAQYQADGQGFLKSEFRHVFVLPATGGKERKLTDGDFNYGSDLSWTPDGKALIFSANTHKDWEYQPRDSDLYQFTLANSQLKQLTNMPGQENSAVFSPDGKHLAFVWGNNEKVPYTNGKLKLMDWRSGEIKDLTKTLDRDVENPQWLDNSSLVIQFDDKGKRTLASVSLSGKLEQMTDELSGAGLPQPYLSGEYSVANEVIAFTRGNAQRPADVAVIANGKTRTLTALNEDVLGHKKLGQVHEINYKSSFDGEPIQGWYITPPDFDPTKKYPMMLEIHGGPHLAYGPHFSAEMQRFAKEGYVVFYDNHRGSSSYGERFAMLLHGKYSSPEDYADHDSGVNAMIDLGFIDKDNLFIAGGSAGGIATAYAVGLTQRYKAAAVVKPIINWLSKVLTGDSYLYQTFHQFPGVPWENVEHYWKRSPLSLVGNVTTPTMLMTGEADRRTPISESEQFYQALKIRKVDTVMVRIPGSPHGIANKPSRMITKIEYILAWFNQYKTNSN
ncbi:S9 family peptidase [Rheinheimera tangshanensis]|uniref:S9 family peptidase n=1 Tax=Rheinheimera tangshanensis TaxID=400153 RepID=A0A5C8M541_9GAMM|nr:S9 family peptidase [Rheinheimera tangshanensis]TXK83059.1 S9 family peptidase [Rheinheimera tangshanensis]GGM46626.1 acyl-peptide hydrolase [Rheinheimera tangshanensis]